MKLIHSFSSLWGIFLHLLLLDTTTLVYSHPHDVFHHRHQAKANDSLGDLDGLELPVLEKRALPDLRVMALGASIVFGVGSTDGNGLVLRRFVLAVLTFLFTSFRKLLRDQLRFSGYKVDMVGTKNGGSMKDNVRILTLIYIYLT